MANRGFLKLLFYEDLPYIAYLSFTFQFFFRGNFENSTPPPPPIKNAEGEFWLRKQF